MRVRRSRKRNSFFDRELNDAIGGIKLVHGLAPTGSGKFDGKIARANEIDGLVDDRTNLRVRAVTVDLDKIEMRQAINQTARGDFAHAPKIIRVELVNVASGKLRRSVWNAVEHLRWVIEKMDRAENVIELVPTPTNWGPPTAILFGYASFVLPPLFRQLVIRGNIIRHVDGLSDPPPPTIQGAGIQVSGCGDLIVEDNLVDLDRATPIEFSLCDKVRFFNDRTSAGKKAAKRSTKKR